VVPPPVVTWRVAEPPEFLKARTATATAPTATSKATATSVWSRRLVPPPVGCDGGGAGSRRVGAGVGGAGSVWLRGLDCGSAAVASSACNGATAERSAPQCLQNLAPACTARSHCGQTGGAAVTGPPHARQSRAPGARGVLQCGHVDSVANPHLHNSLWSSRVPRRVIGVADGAVLIL
jgi:hypothetical protein